MQKTVCRKFSPPPCSPQSLSISPTGFSKDSDTLYLTNPQGEYAFPLKNLRTIRTVYEDATIPHWQKNDDFDSDNYKAYSITYNKNLGIFQTSPYHILELELNGEIWGIYFPCYEIRTIENLTGLKDWGF